MTGSADRSSDGSSNMYLAQAAALSCTCTYVHVRIHSPELLRHLVAELLGRPAGLLGRRLDLLPVLVRPREEHHVSPVQTHEARDYVAGKGRVGVPYVRLVVDVVDGGGHVVRLLGC